MQQQPLINQMAQMQLQQASGLFGFGGGQGSNIANLLGAASLGGSLGELQQAGLQASYLSWEDEMQIDVDNYLKDWDK